MILFKQKALALLLVLSGLIVAISAQEGQPYIGSKEVLEKAYTVHQAHGRNVLSLSTISTGFYDADGNIVDRIIQKGNKTHLGRKVQNISQDPFTKEHLEFNHMNLLSSRKVEIAGTNPGEVTLIEYDAKGKIINKSSTRLHHAKSELWTMDYNEVGYAHRYMHSAMDSTLKLQQQRVFDYFDELREIHNYVYDEDDQLLALIARSPQDSLLFKQEYRYDYLGNLVEEKHFAGDDAIAQSISYSYDYKNRMIQRSEFNWNPRFGGVPQLRKQSDFSYR